MRWKGMLTVLALWVTGNTFAAIPQRINYQGYLTDSVGQPIDGTRSVTFEFYDAETDGNLVGAFSETQTVTVTEGLFNVLIGADTVGGIPAEVFLGETVYLQLTVAGEIFSPRQQVSSVAFAYCALHSDTATDADTVDGIEAADLEESTEITDAIQAHAASGDHDDRYVNVGETDSVTSDMILDDSLTGDDLSSGAALHVASLDLGDGALVARPNLSNPSFESPISANDWVYSEGTYDLYSGSRRTNWFTEGTYSYGLHWGGRASGFCRISQPIYLTDVTSITFDAHLQYDKVANETVRAEVRIDGDLVWSSTAEGTWMDEVIDVSSYSGEHKLRFRLYVAVPAYSYSDADYYVDNVRTDGPGYVLAREGYVVWDEGNDGAGSGLDADLLDGLDSNSFPQVGSVRFSQGTNRSILSLTGLALDWNAATDSLDITQNDGGLPIYYIGIHDQGTPQLVSGSIAVASTGSVASLTSQGHQLSLDVSHAGPYYPHVHVHCIRHSGDITVKWILGKDF